MLLYDSLDKSLLINFLLFKYILKTNKSLQNYNLKLVDFRIDRKSSVESQEC